jgi:glutamyl-tRNA reductase
MVPGESQILAQVKDAYLAAAGAGTTGKHLNVLFQHAFRVGKRVHTHTEIARRRASVSSVAVDLARCALGALSERTVLVIGAGETGKLTLRSLVESGVGRLVVVNRTPGKARDLAEEFRGEEVPWTELVTHLASADIVISCTASRGFVLGRDDVAAAMRARPDQPLVVIDIAVPRDVHPSAAEVPGVTLHDIDDLERVVAEDVDRREREFRRSLEMVEEEVDAFMTWFERHEAEEAIAELIERARSAARAELGRLWERLPRVDEKGRREIDAAVTRIVNRILHEPIAVLKAESQSELPIDIKRIVREVCRLDEASEESGEDAADA